MDRRDFLKTSLAVGSTITMQSCQTTNEKQIPNLLIVFPDQMRAHAMGFMNEDPAITPNLDAFAKESLVLPQAVSNYPVCSPYRAMMMTGKYPYSNKVFTNCTSLTTQYDCELQKTDRCWSDVLKDHNYSLGYIGKWHLDAPREPYIKCANNRGKRKWNEWCAPSRRHGFDFWYSYGTYDYHNTPMYWKSDAKREDFHTINQWGPEHEADMAINFMKNSDSKYRNPNKPFALVVSMNPPHTPYHLVPKKYLKQYENININQLCNRPNIPPANTPYGKCYRRDVRNYFAQCTGVDDQFGRILDTLKKEGLAENTIVLFTSDHGNCLGIHNMITKNNHYEESMRVPFIIRWTNKIPARKDNLLISVPDLYPTLLDLMGLKNSIPKSVEGTSYANHFKGKTDNIPTSQLYIKIPHDAQKHGKRGVRTSRYTMMIDKMPNKKTKTVLFDNQKDPYQLKNIAAEQPILIAKLTKEELIPWLKKTNDPWPIN